MATIERREGGVAVHRLAEVVVASHFGLGRRGLAICGTSADAGIGIVANSLATALCMQKFHALLVNAQPAARASDADGVIQCGLSEFLSDESVTLDAVIQTDVLPGLDLVSPGSPRSQDLYESERFSQFCSEAMRRYACTVFSAPPFNRSACGLTIARNVGHALIVARASRTFYDDLVKISEDLRKDGVQIVGSIMVESK